MPGWRVFTFKGLRAAQAYAAEGGIAVHMSGSHVPPDRTTPCPCAHLFGPDRATLTAAAGSLGLRPAWIQYPDDPRRMHFDLWADPLAEALRRCLTSPTDPEAGASA